MVPVIVAEVRLLFDALACVIHRLLGRFKPLLGTVDAMGDFIGGFMGLAEGDRVERAMLTRVVGVQNEKVKLQYKVVDLLLDEMIDACNTLVLAHKQFYGVIL